MAISSNLTAVEMLNSLVCVGLGPQNVEYALEEAIIFRLSGW